MYDTDGVSLLTIGSEDIINNLDDDVMYQAIYGATKHMDFADYYHMAIEDAIFYLKNYVTSNEEEYNATT